MHILICTFPHTDTHTHMHAHISTLMHANTHTHTHTLPVSYKAKLIPCRKPWQSVLTQLLFLGITTPAWRGSPTWWVGPQAPLSATHPQQPFLRQFTSHFWTLMSPCKQWTQWVLPARWVRWGACRVSTEWGSLSAVSSSTTLLRWPYMGWRLLEGTVPGGHLFHNPQGHSFSEIGLGPTISFLY